MSLRKLVWTFPALLCLICLVQDFCEAEATKPLTVYTTNYPLQYFGERIIGSYGSVKFVLPRDRDPAFWNPDPETIRKLQRADLILINGAGYEKWLTRVSLPMSKIVNTSADFKDQYVAEEHAVTHSHGPTGEHSHHGTAFTTWLNFELAALQAKTIARALVKKLPSQKAELEQNRAALERDLMDLHHAMEELGKTVGDKPLLASHPVYQYLRSGYRLNLLSLHWEPNTMPSEGEWKALTVALKKHPARIILWEGEPLPQSKSRLEQMGIQSITFSPLGNVPKTGDFLSLMQRNMKGFQETVRERG